MLAVYISLLLVSGISLPASAQAPNSRVFHGAVTVVLATLPHADPGVMVRVRRIELAGDGLRLELENSGSLPVVAAEIRYELFECGVDGFAALWPAADGKRKPGMVSIDIPAHGRVWYENVNMASRLAFSALRDKSRYVEARPEVRGVAFANGEETRWQDWSPPKPQIELQGDVCDKWRWDDVLRAVHGFRPPSEQPGNGLSESDKGGTRVTYSCSVVDDVLSCPDHQPD